MKTTPFIAKVYIEYYSYFGFGIIIFGEFLRLVVKPPKRQKYYYLEEYITIDSMLYNDKLPLDDSCFIITPEGEQQFKEQIISILEENRLYYEEPLLQKQIDKFLKRWKQNKKTKT